MIRSGVDLIEIDRVQASVDRFGERFLNRVFTRAEQELCAGKTSSLAARFAAKEAVAKALGTGIWRSGIEWTDIEVLRDADSGEPVLLLHGAAAARAHDLGAREWSISLTHARESAIAFTVVVG